MIPPVNLPPSYYEAYFLHPVRDTIRPYFFPLFDKQFMKNFQNQMEIERRFVQDFWDVSKPLYPGLPCQKNIRESFTCRIQRVPVEIKGKSLSTNCCVIETKDCKPGGECYNFVHVLGIFSTVDNTIMNTYPLLAAYLDRKERLPARFILISSYETMTEKEEVYEPQTLDEEAGLILHETLKSLEKMHGPIHHLLAYSLGCIVTAASLKHFEQADRMQTSKQHTFSVGSGCAGDQKIKKIFQGLPKHITFDRGPSSVEQLSKLYTGGFILLPLARLSGWDIDLGKEIFSFVRKMGKEASSVTVFNAKQDHRFGKSVNLYENPYIVELREKGELATCLFDVPLQYASDLAQHSLSLGTWNRYHVVESNKEDILQNCESLAHALIDESIPK